MMISKNFNFYLFNTCLNRQVWLHTKRNVRFIWDITTVLPYQFLTVTKLFYSYIFMKFSFSFDNKITSCLQTSDRSWSKCLRISVMANLIFFFLLFNYRLICRKSFVLLVPLYFAFLLVEKISFELGKCYLIKWG